MRNTIQYKPVFNRPTISEPDSLNIKGYQLRFRPQQDVDSTQIVSTPITEKVQEDTPINIETEVPLITSSKSKQEDNLERNQESPKGKIYKNNNEFKSELEEAYAKELRRRGISADYVGYLVAQDSIESNYGKSSLSEYYNFGGIKAREGDPYIEKETIEHDKHGNKQKITAKFRVFKNLDDYCRYKVGLLNGKRYRAFDGDSSGFASRVKNGGYATDINYIKLINDRYRTLYPKPTKSNEELEELIKRNSIYIKPLSAKYGGTVPSRIDILVSEFNKIFK